MTDHDQDMGMKPKQVQSPFGQANVKGHETSPPRRELDPHDEQARGYGQSPEPLGRAMCESRTTLPVWLMH